MHTDEGKGDCLRVVCISDTHSMHNRIEIPYGDILIHAGDFTNTGTKKQIEEFVRWMSGQPHKYKVFIAGNHDVTIHKDYYESIGRDRFHARKSYNPEECIGILNSSEQLTYLEDSGTEIETIKIWGSPWQPEFCNWAFNLDRGEALQEKWRLIPDDTDILITHSPPFGIGDRCLGSDLSAGCEDLLSEIKNRILPRLHIFGHIHEGYGVTCSEFTFFVNASTCTFAYRPTNEPIVIDLPLDKSMKPVLISPKNSQAINDMEEFREQYSEKDDERLETENLIPSFLKPT